MSLLKWPNTLVIVRHGESIFNVPIDLLDPNLEDILLKRKQISDVDVQLTEKGLFQSQQTGIYLSKHIPFDICFSSPYKRTLQTAEGIISNLDYDLKIYKDNRLREKEFGLFHGYISTEIKKLYPDEYNAKKRDGKYWYRRPGGENYPDVELRVHSFLDKLSRNYAGKNVLIVTHQVPYILFRALFEHLDEKEVLDLGNVPNCGIEEFIIDTSKYGEGRLKLNLFNEIAYKI